MISRSFVKLAKFCSAETKPLFLISLAVKLHRNEQTQKARTKLPQQTRTASYALSRSSHHELTATKHARSDKLKSDLTHSKQLWCDDASASTVQVVVIHLTTRQPVVRGSNP